MKKKKKQTPLILSLMRVLFPLLEKLMPKTMDKLYIRMFFRPTKYPFKAIEKEAIRRSRVWQIKFKDKLVQVYKWGNGPKKALFVHGWSGRGAQGHAFIEPFLNNEYTFFAFDLPGHGLSTGNETNVFEVADIITEIAEAFGEFDCIIGHSFGGIVATYAKLQKLPFRKLVLIGSPHDNEYILSTFKNTIGARRDFNRTMEDFVQRKWNLSFDDFSIHRMIESIDEDDVLIIHDKQDKEVPFSLVELSVDKLSQAHFIQTEGLGHKRILENSHVVESVLSFSNQGSREAKLHLN